VSAGYRRTRLAAIPFTDLDPGETPRARVSARTLRVDDLVRNARLNFFDDAAEETEHLSVKVRDWTFLVATADKGVGRVLFVKRSRSEFGILARALEVLDQHERQVGGTFVDCGANIGTTTIAALERFDRVIAFEPEPRNARLLAANVALNGLADRVEIHEAAVSDRVGEAQLVVHQRNMGANLLRETGELTVAVVTLDEAIPEGEPVGMIWLDIQGHEPQALAGATRFRVPTVVEVHWPLDAVMQEITDRYEHVVHLREPKPGQEDKARVTDLLLF
jgi:FkbM family methyltransferase